jgi:hypothetical protein
MGGFLFIDSEQRLCMTLDDETIRKGDSVRAVVWTPAERRWGAPTRATYAAPARSADLAGFDPMVVETPALVGPAVWPIHWQRTPA